MLTNVAPRGLGAPAWLARRYHEVRGTTEALVRPLAVEDHVLQAMPDVSPTKWHLAHVSWFFETFLLAPHLPGYAPLNPAYRFLFNSYYNAVGPQFTRAARGPLSRPTVAEVLAYRAWVDQGMTTLLQEIAERPEVQALVELGLHHEQQHQELILTDIKYNLAVNPLHPAYHAVPIPRGRAMSSTGWREHAGGLAAIGHDGRGFAFDNESPRHAAYLRPRSEERRVGRECRA